MDFGLWRKVKVCEGNKKCRMVCCVGGAKRIPQMTQINTLEVALGIELVNCRTDWRSKIGNILPATVSPSTMEKLRLFRQQTPLSVRRYDFVVVERDHDKI